MLPLASAPVQAKHPNAVFGLDFGSPSDVADVTATSAGWTLDRYNGAYTPPVQFTRAMFDGDYRLCIELNGDGPTSGFYGYQGKKYLDAGEAYWNAGTGSRVSYQFYIDPAWETDGVGQETGVWLTLGDADGNISAYPILEYQDSEANEETGEAGFRVFVYVSDDDGNFEEARWEYVGLPKKLKIDPEEGGWVTVEAQLQRTNDGAALKWRVENKLIVDERGYNVFAPSTQFLEFIFNSGNFGADEQYYYDDFALSTPGNARNK
jgi:hypothetical protein